MQEMTHEAWRLLQRTAREISDGFEHGVIFIGGLAVQAHVAATAETSGFSARTHDGDFAISRVDFQDLRDIEIMVPNRRLQKYQFTKNGFEFDVYVEGEHGLPVPYEEMSVLSEIASGLRVAAPEHLLAMKETALASRGGTPKGEKDEADMFLMLVVVANRGTSPERVARIGDDLVSVLHGVCDRAAGRVAGGNAHLASILRARAREGLRAIEDARPGPGCRL